MRAGIHFRVELRALWHAIQRLQLGQDRAQCMGVMQGAQEGRRPRRGEGATQLLPDALRHQRIEFTAGGDFPHQRHGLLRHGEAQGGEARHEAGRAQHPQRIFNEGRTDVAQHALLDIAHAAIRIHQGAGGFIAGDGVDGEIATLQVFFQRHRRIGIDHEAAVAAAGLALGAGQRVFLAGVGMQEHREIAAHGLVALRVHLRLGGPDHDPVAVAGSMLQKAVAHRAANQIDLHAAMMPQSGRAVLAKATGGLSRRLYRRWPRRQRSCA